jgi:hypothetical protein
MGIAMVERGEGGGTSPAARMSVRGWYSKSYSLLLSRNISWRVMEVQIVVYAEVLLDGLGSWWFSGQ